METAEVGSSKFRVSDGDWVCSDPQCANLNFARRTSCNRCNKERDGVASKKKLGQEIGKAAAEKSKGLFSADDWICSKCCNINWARRQQCNMCNAPKFGDTEERTGYGGGYNDRGVVEYVKRDDSDDEYDEFGRRKKKQRDSDDDESDSNNDDNRESASRGDEEKLHDKEVEEEDEEEEDEDDDDDDLSKYDLTEWDDLASDNQTNSNEKKRDRDEKQNHHNSKSSRERSRSRSRSPY